METARTASGSTTPAGGAAVGLAAAALASLTAANLANRTAAPDELISLGFLFGWALLAWGALVGLGVVVHLVRGATGRTPTRMEIALVAATAIIVVATAVAYPLVGSGGGSA